MLTVVQFPIADARGLREDTRGRLMVPDWPSPRTDVRPQFVRRFGPAQDRAQVVDQAWADEHAYCRASRAITFTGGVRTIGVDRSAFVPTVAFRRLFVDVTGVVVRVEVGLTSRRQQRSTLQLTQASLLAGLSELLVLETKVAGNGQKPARLIEQGARLGRLYRQASTGHGIPSMPSDDRLVEDGNPLVVVMLDPGELVGELDAVTRIPANRVGGASLAFGWFKHPAIAGRIGIWYIKPGSATVENNRLLRLCLLRLHAERECLDSILRQVRRDVVTLNAPDQIANTIQRYLNRATRAISRDSWNNISQSAILEAIDAAVSVGEPDDAADLQERLDLARRQVADKVLEYAQQRNAPRVVQAMSVETLNASEVTVTKGEFTFKGRETTFINRPAGAPPEVVATGRSSMNETTKPAEQADTDGDPAAAAGGGDVFNFQGQNTTFINRPKEIVLKDFQNTYLRGDGSTADQVNEQLEQLIALIHDSQDLSPKDKEDVAQAVTSVAEDVRDDKANGITVKGVLEGVSKVLSTAADIAPTAAAIVASVVKIFTGI